MPDHLLALHFGIVVRECHGVAFALILEISGFGLTGNHVFGGDVDRGEYSDCCIQHHGIADRARAHRSGGTRPGATLDSIDDDGGLRNFIEDDNLQFLESQFHLAIAQEFEDRIAGNQRAGLVVTGQLQERGERFIVHDPAAEIGRAHV